MKLLTLIRAKKYGSPKKMILLALLMIALVGLFLQITWSYHSLESGLGAAVAQIAVMYHVALLMVLVVTGIGLGHWIDQMIRLKRSIFHDPQKGSWTEAFMNLWGYELKEKDANQTITPEPQMIEPFDLFKMPTRRGRKPTFPLERWIPIAMKWENRDPIRDAFTLGELIAEHLGTNSDGSPIVSEQTYYSVWRQRAIDEIRRRVNSRPK
ncbi:MAG: hypothetical protein JNM55_18470 [Anaerolineales bacterium]|nr:hypothetical protein [Anaerolineales bacterium]